MGFGGGGGSGGGGGGSSSWGSITGAISSQTDLQTELDSKQATLTGSNSRIIFKDSTGESKSLEPFTAYDDGTLNYYNSVDVNDAGFGKNLFQLAANCNPSENSPGDSWTAHSVYMNIDANGDGFSFGTSGTAVTAVSTNVVHSGKSDIGAVNLLSQNFNIGNGTDPISIEGIGYAFGFGQINNNVTVNSWIQGYGFQPSIAAGATFNGYVTGFYDNANIDVAVGGYTSINVGPQIAEIKNNTGYNGININPAIDAFAGNGNANALAVGGNYNGFDTGGVNAVNVNPYSTDNSAAYVYGLNVTLDNFTVKAGAQSSVVIQDLTITFVQNGDNNSYSIQYFDTGTAGAETVALNGNNIEISMESGVSTANQIKAAIEATIGINSAVTVAISGTGTNTQVTAGPISFTGGVWPGTKKAAYLDGDVEISGALTFGGALSIGALNAYKSQAMVNGGGTPTSVHQLISAPTVADNTTVALADTMGINTAMLLQIGNNSTVTTALLGASALALPAVVAVGTGSTIDRVAGSSFAISLQAGAAGTIDEVDLCRALGIPNGTTTVNKLYGYKFDLPYGDPGTTSWGFYESPGKHNYFAGDLLIGGTSGSDDTVTNSSVALEIKSTTKAAVLSRMTTAERNAMTAVNGMLVYNSSTDKFQGYAGGSWIDLH